MFGTIHIIILAVLVPLAVVIAYYDVRYRRIPNVVVLATLLIGLVINTFFGGLNGLLVSVGGLLLAFGLMLVIHILGAMGAGDVKLFAAIGSVLGFHMVMRTFVVIVMLGAVLALISMLRAGNVRETMRRVLRIYTGFLPGQKMARYEAPADRRFTIPYGVAITLGSIISLAFFRG